jgi:hypothetical protein
MARAHPSVRIYVLGSLEIRGAQGAPTFPPDVRIPRVALAVLGLKESYTHQEFVNALWPGYQVLKSDGTKDNATREKIHKAASEARPYLGNARRQVISRYPQIRLAREPIDKTNAAVTTDADDFDRLRSSNDPTKLREAVRLIRGPIGKGLPTDEYQEQWFEERRDKFAGTLFGLLQRIYPDTQDLDDLTKAVLTHGGDTVIGASIGIAVPSQVQWVPRDIFIDIAWQSLGVTPAAIGSTPMPQHLNRSVDPLIDERLEGAADAQSKPDETNLRDRFVLLEGPSKCGKTRALFEAVRRHETFKRTETLTPANDDPDDIADCLEEAAHSDTRLLLWLDDIDGHCSYQSDSRGLTASRLRRALSNNPRLVILATAGGKGPLRTDPNRRQSQIWQDVLKLIGRPLELAGGVDFADVRQAQEANWSDDVVTAIERYGLGPALSAGPDLVQRLRLARDTDGDRYGWALASAIGLLQETWFFGPVPERVVRAAWLGLLAQRLHGVAEEEAWSVALAFAFGVIGRDTKLVSEEGAGLALHDYVRPRLVMTGAEARRTFQAAAKVMTAGECEMVASRSWSDDSTLRPLIRLASEGNDEALLLIHFWLSYRADWPVDDKTIEASVRFACWVGYRILHGLDNPNTVLYTFMYLENLPAPVFEAFCERMERSLVANADITVSALRIIRGEPHANDINRLVAAGSEAPSVRAALAEAYILWLPFHLDLPQKLLERLDSRNNLKRGMFTPVDSAAGMAKAEQFLAAAIAEDGADKVALELARHVELSDDPPNRADHVLPIFDKVIEEESPRIAFSRALIALSYDYLDSGAEEVLLTFVGSEGDDLSRQATQRLLTAYHERQDYDSIYALLERVPWPVLANRQYWRKPLHYRQRSWLVGRVQQGEREAAALLCRLTDNPDAENEAFEIVERSADLATPYTISEIAQIMCGDRFTSDGVGPATGKARQLCIELLRGVCLSPPAFHPVFAPTSLLVRLLTDSPGGADEATVLLDNLIQSGNSSVASEVGRLEGVLGADRARWLLDRAETIKSEALEPVWEWARTLPWPEECDIS